MPVKGGIETIDELKRQTEAMAKALNVRGLMNVQFAIEEPQGESPRIYVLEVNPRASRTVPFVAKTIGVGMAVYLPLQGVQRTLGVLGVLPSNRRRVLLPEQPPGAAA